MSIDTAEYARLAADSYEDRSRWVDSNEWFTLKGSDVRYKVLAAESNPKTDYQGTAYQRLDTKEVIIAHRGTESAKDGMTDAGMVFNGRNNQLDDAVAFTDRSIAIAKERAHEKGHALNVSFTGHSLGGTLAEITAARTGLHAETFNSYGPGALTGLDRYGVDVKAAHPNIVNHVRATDVVGSGGPHLGSTRTYAAPEDIENLKRGRYIGPSSSSANPLLAADINAHTIRNFLPNNDVIRDSVLSPANEAQARANAAAIARYRDDVVQGRMDVHKLANNLIPMASVLNGARLAGQVLDATTTTVTAKVGEAGLSGVQAAGAAVHSNARRVGQALDEATRTLRDSASRAGDKLSRPASWLSSQADPVPPALITDPAHPGQAMFAQAQGHLQTINRKYGVPCDQRTDNAAACLATAARQAGMTSVDHLRLNDGAGKIFAVQGTPGTAWSKYVGVDTVQALDTPIAQSSQAFVVADVQAREQQALEQQAQQERQHSQQLAQPVRMRI